MSDTVIESSRNVVNVDSVQKFRIVTVCTAKGDLPDSGIFVQQIMDSDDPAEDEFVRVSEIIDFETYLNDRTAAVAAGAEYWRSYTLTKFYTDIEVAVAAKTAIQDRVDELVTDYVNYTTYFLDPSDIVDLPTGQATLLQALNNAYNSAYDVYETAVATEAAAQIAKDDADTELTVAQTAQQNADAVKSSAIARTGEMVAAQSSMSLFTNQAAVLVNAIATFETNSGYPTGDPTVDAAIATLLVARDQFVTNRTAFDTAVGDASAGVTNHQGLEALIQSSIVAPADARLTTAEEDVRATTLALAEADAEAAAAYLALENAYAAAKSACNTWSPDAGKSFPPIS